VAGGICNSSEILNSTSPVSACDARYVALAERLAMPLLTGDAKLAGAPGHHADIQHYLG
jgi:predicted nucleic acid-binding protein